MAYFYQNTVTFFSDSEEELRNLEKRMAGRGPYYHNENKEKEINYFNFNNIISVPNNILEEGFQLKGKRFQQTYWGTSHNSTSVSVEDIKLSMKPEIGKYELVYDFCTVNGPPKNIIEKLPEFFNSISFEWSYTESSIPDFGHHSYISGDEINQSGDFFDINYSLRDYADYNSLLTAVIADNICEYLVEEARMLLELN